MAAPTLPKYMKNMDDYVTTAGEHSDPHSKEHSFLTRITTEHSFLGRIITRLTPLTSLASPIIFTAMIREISEVSTIIFVGRTGGATAMGAATLGNMMCNITGKLPSP